MTREELFDLVRPFVISLTGVSECILADQNGDSPDGEYAVVEPFTSIIERGQAQKHCTAVPADRQVEISIRPNVIARCSIQFYRGDAQTRAVRIKGGIKRDDIVNTLRAAGVQWISTDAVNNLNGLQSDNVESRAEVMISLAYHQIDEPYRVNTIESVEIEPIEIFGVTP